jgi:hypothetical protein
MLEQLGLSDPRAALLFMRRQSDFAAVEQLLLAEKELIFQRPTDAVSL